ncbi:MAG: hypothetical protein DRQ49_07760 [Gammaproteobacteria bacterium]|nr:MAG: hypothetical protein DRQ49_07760 [Gammaproteobacteria bacterium]RKZ73052.1 MAG: hypothetical protein DRQ57_15600 [Gammaproteobacteria bacterium]
MQKQLFGAVLASTFFFVGCDDGKKSVAQIEDNLGSPSTSCEMMLQDKGKVTEQQYAITSPLPCTEIDPQNGFFSVTCNIKNFTQDKAEGKLFWISIEDVKQAKHFPKFPVGDENCSSNMIHEGNDSNDKREMKVLLLRIDDDTDQKFHQWMKEGPDKGYPGFPLIQNDIVATVPIFIP